MLLLIVLLICTIIACCLIAVIVALVSLKKPKDNGTPVVRQDLPYRPIARLLTDAEFRFYLALVEVANPSYCIMAKVRVADILEVKPRTPNFFRAFNQISAKHVDFVICEPQTMSILAAFELDDSTHQQTKRRERDDFLNHAFESARVPLVRMPVSREYDRQSLRTIFYQAVDNGKSSKVQRNQQDTGSAVAIRQ
jgi:hypothetical protein